VSLLGGYWNAVKDSSNVRNKKDACGLT
jgi:hypothetical protein